MTATYRLRGGGWLIATALIAVAFYLVSLRVADERKRLEGVNARIAAADRDIRALETEFDTRANLVQLEKWNGDTLALAAPTAGQFVRDEGQLASLDVNAAAPEVQTAALVVPAIAAPAPAAASPLPIAAAPVAVAHLAKPRATPLVDAAARAQPELAAVPGPSPRMQARLAASERAARAVAKVRPQAVAMLDDKLLSDSTLGDLVAQAKREARRRN